MSWTDYRLSCHRKLFSEGVLFDARTKETSRESGQQFALSSESQFFLFALLSFESSLVLIAFVDFFFILFLIYVRWATLSPTSWWGWRAIKPKPKIVNLTCPYRIAIDQPVITQSKYLQPVLSVGSYVHKSKY